MKGKILPNIYLSTKMVMPAIVQISEGIPPDNDSAFSQCLVSGWVTNPKMCSSMWHALLPGRLALVAPTSARFFHIPHIPTSLYDDTWWSARNTPHGEAMWNIARSRFAFSRHFQLIWKWNSSSPSHFWVVRKPDGVASTKSGLQDSVDLRMEHMPHYCHVKFYLTGE